MSSLPKKAGVCLKAQHADQIMAEKPQVGWFEVHAENYLGNGGKPLSTLTWIRDNYPPYMELGYPLALLPGLTPNIFAVYQI